MVVIDCTDGPKEQPDPPHHHPHEQITFVAEGEVIFFIDGEPYHLSAGDMIAVAPNLPHTIQPLTPKVRLVELSPRSAKNFCVRITVRIHTGRN